MSPLGTPTPVGGGSSVAPAGRGGNLSYSGPGGSLTPSPAPRSEGDPSRFARRPSGGYTIGADSAVDPISAEGPVSQPSWSGPRFAPVEDPWLKDALRKAEVLGRRYPVQAFIEYSVEPDLPFTLVLERATPAMAVRSMVDFVGFLASIATPRRARIELRSVVHLDRSFYRSVMSAMEPYFPDTVDIRQQGYRVEISFLEPDPSWGRYPILPLED